MTAKRKSWPAEKKKNILKQIYFEILKKKYCEFPVHSYTSLLELFELFFPKKISKGIFLITFLGIEEMNEIYLLMMMPTERSLFFRFRRYLP